jgi:hypothetical protein
MNYKVIKIIKNKFCSHIDKNLKHMIKVLSAQLQSYDSTYVINIYFYYIFHFKNKKNSYIYIYIYISIYTSTYHIYHIYDMQNI